jgi:hypothetical protein
MRAERRQNPENPERYRVRLLAPPGMGSVYTFSRRTINVGPDGTIEMSADDAQSVIRAGWTKLAEWTDDAAEGEQIEERNKPPGPTVIYAKGSMEWEREQEEQRLARIAAEEEKERRRLARIAAVLKNKS